MALARAGHRVLLIDLDPQAHLTLHLGIDPKAKRPGVYELLTGSTTIAKTRVKVGNNAWVIGSSIDLAAAEVELVSVVGREVILRDLLDQHISGNGRSAQYDYVLMDCPPSLSVLTLNGLCAAQEVLIPLQPHYLALQGLGKLLETVSLVSKRINPDLKVSGVAVCMYDPGTKLGAEVVDDVRSFFEKDRGGHTPWSTARVFDSAIRRNIKLAESPSYGQSIFDYAPDSNGAHDYEQLAREIHGADVAEASPIPMIVPVPVPAITSQPIKPVKPAPRPSVSSPSKTEERSSPPAPVATAPAATIVRDPAKPKPKVHTERNDPAKSVARASTSPPVKVDLPQVQLVKPELPTPAPPKRAPKPLRRVSEPSPVNTDTPPSAMTRTA